MTEPHRMSHGRRYATDAAELSDDVRLRTRDIDPKKLIYYATVIDQGSFTKAAKILGVKQPALSISMNRLEAMLGVKIMERGSQGVATTPQGDLLYSHARRIRDELFLADRNLHSEVVHEKSPIRLGCLMSLTSNVVPSAIARWRSGFPDTELHVADATQFDLMNGLLCREHDFVLGFTERHQFSGGLRQRVLFRDRLCVVARPGHPLFTERELTPSSLVNYPWASLPSGPFDVRFENIFESAGISLVGGVTICVSIALMKTLMSCSDHLGLLPRHAVQTEIADGRLTVLPITMPEFSRSIAIFFREGSTIEGPSRALVDEIQLFGSQCYRADG
ncbi:LysR family transcriptional regulator [Mesorhizobium carmichaelinearum]|uniref:LysR family transcriptional regulator n=1 Tax=Mesorhizobium carmichaelinearum TaxID=1208188 RepID=UPI000BA3F982|nr:LysR family transcriptional regulator [Mesorhizobium carmichaelinearum]